MRGRGVYMVHRVVAAALVRDGRALLVHRRPDRLAYPDCWDLPGGHVEPGESPRDALARELAEELGVRVVVEGAPGLRVEVDPDSAEGLVLDAWVVRTWNGTPVNAAEDEHDALRWCSAEELGGLRLAHPAVRAFLEAVLTADTD